MNATASTATETRIPSTATTASSAFEFCGKGLHYDWRAIVVAAEAADLDAELAQLGAAPALS